MRQPKSQREHEAELIIGVGSQGTAALGLLRNLFRALHAKGILSHLEVAAIFDATVDQARGDGTPAGEKYAESVRINIRKAEIEVQAPGPRTAH